MFELVAGTLLGAFLTWLGAHLWAAFRNRGYRAWLVRVKAELEREKGLVYELPTAEERRFARQAVEEMELQWAKPGTSVRLCGAQEFFYAGAE